MEVSADSVIRSIRQAIDREKKLKHEAAEDLRYADALSHQAIVVGLHKARQIIQEEAKSAQPDSPE